MDEPIPNRRRFRFGLRTLFVVVTVASMWCAYSMNWIRQRHEAIESGKVLVLSVGQYRFPERQAPWSIRLFGEKGIGWIVIEPDGDFKRIRRLFPETFVSEYPPDD